MTQDVVSFMLRFVREASEEQQARWRGVVQHVQSDAEQQFSQFAEALAFMQQHINETTAAAFKEAGVEPGKNPFVETARLWGDFLPQYNKMLFERWTEAMAQTVSMPQQMMNKMLAAWGMPTADDQVNAADKVAALSAQIAALNQKVARLQAQLAEQEQKSAADEGLSSRKGRTIHNESEDKT